MLPLHLKALLIAGPFLLTRCHAQQTRAPRHNDYPECAATCIAAAFHGGWCPSLNQTCACVSQEFQQNVTACVSVACTVPESLLTLNTTLASCGATPRDRGQELVTVTAVLASISGAFTVTRFVYKLLLAHLDLGLDDWLVLVTMISAVPSAVVIKFGSVPNGLGRDIWTLRPQQFTNVGKFFYIMACLYFLQTALLKLSFISFYMRIFPAPGIRRLLWGTFALTAVWGTAFILTSIFQCRPISYFWTKWDGMHQGSCSNANAISWSHAAMSIALDLWILAVPLWQLRSLKMHWKKKIGVAVMFCMGTFVTVVSILRLQSLVEFAATSNSTWEFYQVSLWSTIEICIGIICACLPTIRLILVRLIPRLGGSTQQSRYYAHGSGVSSSGVARPKGSSHRRSTVNIDSASKPGSENSGSGEHRGIMFQKSYAIHYSDNDEASLVLGHVDISSDRKGGTGEKY